MLIGKAYAEMQNGDVDGTVPEELVQAALSIPAEQAIQRAVGPADAASTPAGNAASAVESDADPAASLVSQ